VEAVQAETMAVESAPTKPRWRPRFSLAALLSATVMAGLVFHSVVAHRMLEAVKAENDRLKIELGEKLLITDPGALGLRQKHYEFDSPWLWRLYVPKEQKYALRCTLPSVMYCGDDNYNSIKSKRFPLPAGEFDVDVHFEQHKSGSQTMVVGIASYVWRIEGYDPGLLNGCVWTGNKERRTTREIGWTPGWTETLINARKLVLKSNGEVDHDSKEPTAGILIWIEQDTGK
jgi:hypothetical protein